MVLDAVVGDDVTVGRYGLVHACTLGDGVVVGESSVILDGTTIGPYALIAADTVVPPRKTLPGGYVYAGHPAKPIREIGRDELAQYARSLRSGSTHADVVSARLPAWADVVQSPPRDGGSLHAVDGVLAVYRAYVADAIVAGDVTLGDDASIFSAVPFVPTTGASSSARGPTQDTDPGDESRAATSSSAASIGHNVELGSGTIGDDARPAWIARRRCIVAERGGAPARGSSRVPSRPRLDLLVVRRRFRELKPAERGVRPRRDIYVARATTERGRRCRAWLRP
jgi:carbonic anhydrase/acetyltransferase-like protein (isoleucine patch superfamily)